MKPWKRAYDDSDDETYTADQIAAWTQDEVGPDAGIDDIEMELDRHEIRNETERGAIFDAVADRLGLG